MSDTSTDTPTGPEGGEPNGDTAPAAPNARVIDGDKPTPADVPAKPADKNGDSDGGGEQAKPRTDWREHSRTWEKRAGEHKSAAEKAAQKAQAAEDKLKAVLKAAGLDDTEDEDPTEAVKRASAERDAAVAKAAKLEADRVAERVARGLGADVDRLLDSKSVDKALAALDDPADTDAVKAVLAKALDEHPHLKAAPAPAAKPSGSAEHSGGSGEGKPPSGPSSVEDFRKARSERRRF